MSHMLGLAAAARPLRTGRDADAGEAAPILAVGNGGPPAATLPAVVFDASDASLVLRSVVYFAFLLAWYGSLRYVPVGLAIRGALRLKTWDRLELALPWARVTAVVGAPIDVPADVDAAGIEALRARLERELVELDAEAAR